METGAIKKTAIYPKYIEKALGNFLKQLKTKRPFMFEQKWFHWDNASVHTAAVAPQYPAARAPSLLA
jgi:hypothetical protein